MNDIGFVVAGYGVVLGGLAVYAVLLLRRLSAARREAITPSDVAANRHEEA
jgi:hypothetical protein